MSMSARVSARGWFLLGAIFGLLSTIGSFVGYVFYLGFRSLVSTFAIRTRSRA